MLLQPWPDLPGNHRGPAALDLDFSLNQPRSQKSAAHHKGGIRAMGVSRELGHERKAVTCVLRSLKKGPKQLKRRRFGEQEPLDPSFIQF